jgi:hypothetical protein
MSEGVELWSNDAWRKRREAPALSICVPFFRFDVAELADRLIYQSNSLRDSVELAFADDGSGDVAATQALRSKFANCGVPAILASFESNQGRAIIRNYLIDRAQGRYVLFMDSDMLPDAGNFVARYLDLAREGGDDIVVGGSSYKQLEQVPRLQYLHYYQSNRTQCVALNVRQRSPVRYVLTNNVMIRRDLLRNLAFDEQYVGWGYEDTDWTISAVRQGARILHIDNTASHLGLIDDATLIGKYRNSAGNYLRLATKFPLETSNLPVSKAVRWVSRIPLPFTALTNALEALVRVSFVPAKLRYVFLQCFKVALYSGTCRQFAGRPWK